MMLGTCKHSYIHTDVDADAKILAANQPNPGPFPSSTPARSYQFAKKVEQSDQFRQQRIWRVPPIHIPHLQPDQRVMLCAL